MLGKIRTWPDMFQYLYYSFFLLLFVSYLSMFWCDRLPCLVQCSLVARCRDRQPLHMVGRESHPVTIQYQVHNAFNNRIGLPVHDQVQPPHYIKQLVKGLSTDQVMQVYSVYNIYTLIIHILFRGLT